MSSRSSRKGKPQIHKEWTKQDIDTLRDMRRRKYTFKAIALKMDRTQASVEAKASELGIRKKSTKWTENEDDLLKRYIKEGLSRTLIAIKLNRKIQAINNRVRKLGGERLILLSR